MPPKNQAHIHYVDMGRIESSMMNAKRLLEELRRDDSNVTLPSPMVETVLVIRRRMPLAEAVKMGATAQGASMPVAGFSDMPASQEDVTSMKLTDVMLSLLNGATARAVTTKSIGAHMHRLTRVPTTFLINVQLA